MITKGERGAGGFERGGWGVLGAGDKAVQLSVEAGIVPITKGWRKSVFVDK